MCHRSFLTAALVASVVLLAACSSPQVVTIAVTSPPETVVVTATPAPTPTPLPLSTGSKALTICLVGEPDTLYLYGGSRLAATRHVMEALYDGPIDQREYSLQPVILEKVPREGDGDVFIRNIRVRAGDLVVDTRGEPVALEAGVRVRPSHCYDDVCATEFVSGSLVMEKMEVTFAVRQDVTWADGEPVDADDSLFAFEMASDPTTPGRRTLVRRTGDYRALDDWRIKWVGLPGFLDPNYAQNFFAPLPQHQLEGRSAFALLRAEETRRYPLGWGPFVVEEWVAGDHLTLTPNPHYFRSDEGLPYLDQVVFRFAADAPDLLVRLLTGECDIATHDADWQPLVPTLVHAERSGLLHLVSSPGQRMQRLDLGIASEAGDGRADFFGDVRVRQAIAQCVDRGVIVDAVTYGRGVVPDSYLPPTHPLHASEDVARWDYDPVAGRRLLGQAGWQDEDESGVLRAKGVVGVSEDTPFEITLLVASEDVASREIARIVRANLADCGIRVQVNPRPRGELFAPGPLGPVFGRQFDLVGADWWFDDVSECAQYLSSAVPREGQWDAPNVTGYSNAAYDAACEAALQTLPGMVMHKEYHSRAAALFATELPSIPLFMWPRTAVARPGVLNLALDSTSQSELWNIEMLDVE